MSKILRNFSAVCLCTALALSCASCAEKEEAPKLVARDTYAFFHTTTRWAYLPASDEQDEKTWGDVTAMLRNVENTISADIEGSDISRFNKAEAGEKMEISELTYRVLDTAKTMYEKTEGAYNPAVGLLVDLWGFSPRFTSGNFTPQFPYDRADYHTLPDAAYLEAFRTLSDFSAVTVSARGGKYYVTKPETASVVLADEEGREHTYTMQLNLGGIGKGYAVDEAEKIVRAAGYESGYVNIGGSSMCVLSRLDEKGNKVPWEVDVKNPRVSEEFPYDSYFSVVQQGVSLSSSGDYENCYKVDGRRYCHIINPFTGYPVNVEPENEKASGIVCASVFGISAAEGDATTTALMVMGKEKAISYLNKNLAGKDAVFVWYNGEDGSYTVFTNMAEGSYTLVAKNMKLEKF